MNKKITIAVIAILIIGGGFYWFNKDTTKSSTDTLNQSPVNSGENAEPGNGYNLPVEPAAAKARAELATRLSVDEKSIVILQITENTWNDGCLGLGKANESCLLALVPGFRVEMIADGETYFYRTDMTGSAVRAE